MVYEKLGADYEEKEAAEKLRRRHHGVSCKFFFLFCSERFTGLRSRQQSIARYSVRNGWVKNRFDDLEIEKREEERKREREWDEEILRCVVRRSLFIEEIA